MLPFSCSNLPSSCSLFIQCSFDGAVGNGVGTAWRVGRKDAMGGWCGKFKEIVKTAAR